jgi:hypothetical protein
VRDVAGLRSRAIGVARLHGPEVLMVVCRTFGKKETAKGRFPDVNRRIAQERVPTGEASKKGWRCSGIVLSIRK